MLGGGVKNMTKEEANQMAKEIYKEWSKQVEEITEKAIQYALYLAYKELKKR